MCTEREECVRKEEGRGSGERHTATDGTGAGGVERRREGAKLHSGVRTWGRRMETMKLGDSVAHIAECSIAFPLPFLVGKTAPMNQVFNMTVTVA